MAAPRPKKGENFELSVDLNSGYPDRRRDGIKRTIAAMTVGKDVSGLFPDVIKNMQSDDLEQKKLVYLYLMNYAKAQPELVILAVNTFVKDAEDPNPLVRALAIRTMGMIRAEKIIDYLSGPLSKALRDGHPYVRKTAALCVAKLYDLKPELVLENEFLEQLRDMINDSNPMVVANTIAALSDIHATAETLPPDSAAAAAKFEITPEVVNRVLIALPEANEWGRITLMNILTRYTPVDEKESERICERIVPQLQHGNVSVVLAAVKVVMIHMHGVNREDMVKQLVRKMAPPLVTLLSSPAEVQWVALRNINLLLQKRPEILSNELRVFFCKYNDPLYVKLEKLDIMIRLGSENNIDALLSELKEYASEVDVDFVRRSIKAIGQTAVKIEAAAERCVNVLVELISTKVSYVVQEAVVVMKDIFRKYPSTYEGVIPTLCENLEDLDEPEAKASLIWIIGEYASKIDNAADLLGIYVDSFMEESNAVQLQTLTAVVKLFLTKPDSAQGLVQTVLNTATKECDSPDVRDRAYIYWRLLSTDAGAAKAVVLAHRPPISIPRTTIAPGLLDELIRELSSLASVYHKPVATFIGQGRVGVDSVRREVDDLSAQKALATVAQGQHSENLLDFSDEPMDDQITGLAATSTFSSTAAATELLFAQPAAKQLASGLSENPLEDLVSIFGSGSMGVGATPMSGMFASPSPQAGTPIASPPMAQSLPPPPAQQQAASGQEDLLGLF
ncbi:AP complex subunit beta [Mycena kentingensis (nom. inval.)]|nr:AP complex subunit beta [Mycena kentingensis (nom. inval.)]